MKKKNNSLREKAISLLGGVVKNAMFSGSDFLKYGSRGEPLFADWSDAQVSDVDHYKGYGYGAIVRRAVLTALVAGDHVKTDTDKAEQVHPYLKVIESSPTFTDFAFWTTISTFLDLEGWFPLMAIRNFDKERKGNVKEFKLLNPYQVRRVVNYSDEGMVIGGYIENKGGFTREIPPEMIIDIRNLNPFADNVPFGITDAAKDSTFTLRSAGDYTRKSIHNNINAPGILSTDVQLEKEAFDDFIARVKSHKKGEPLFGNGGGKLDWKNMETDLTKAALSEINEINRDEQFSTYGVSKTIMNIEQSGTTRETAKVQKDLIVELSVLPQIQLIIDALNQDYRNNSPQAKTQKLDIICDNPLGTDHDEELKDIQVKTTKFSLYKMLVDRGVKNQIAADYVNGKIELDGIPLEKFEMPDLTALPSGDTPVDKKKKPPVIEDETVFKNDDTTGLVQQQQGALRNAILRIDQNLVFNALNRLPKKMANAVELREKDVITQAEQNEAVRDLELILLGFYGIVVNLQGQNIMRDRTGKYSLPGSFDFDRSVKSTIDKLASKAAASHVETITNEIYKVAHDAALEGKSLREVESLLRQTFAQEITQSRAKVIARSETNRAFTTAQYEADRQFIEQNALQHRAFKQWVTRSDNPCPICQSLAAEKPIPLSENFRNVGDDVNFDGGTYKVSYTSLGAGNAHPNCSCTYELVIIDA